MPWPTAAAACLSTRSLGFSLKPNGASPAPVAPEELLDEVHFIGATRPDGSSVIDATLDELGPKAHEKIHVMEVPEMKLSATYLRDRLRSGKTVRYMLPKCVVDYIAENHIYGKE